MKLRWRVIVFALLSISACSRHGNATALSLKHPDDATRTVEYFLRAPTGPGPWPTVIFLHGHQNWWNNAGGAAFSNWGVLDDFAKRGYLAASISLPGYGNSTGPSDFAGPATQHAVSAVIEKLKAEGYASDKVVIEGISLGAVTAALVAERDPSISGIVLISGLYDLPQFIAHPKSLQAWMLKYSIVEQTGGGVDALQARSALSFTQNIKASALIMNGALDDRTDPEQARMLADAIVSHGGTAQVHIFPEYGHQIPVQARQKEIDAFIENVLNPAPIVRPE